MCEYSGECNAQLCELWRKRAEEYSEAAECIGADDATCECLQGMAYVAKTCANDLETPPMRLLDERN